MTKCDLLFSIVNLCLFWFNNNNNNNNNNNTNTNTNNKMFI